MEFSNDINCTVSDLEGVEGLIFSGYTPKVEVILDRRKKVLRRTKREVIFDDRRKRIPTFLALNPHDLAEFLKLDDAEKEWVLSQYPALDEYKLLVLCFLYCMEENKFFVECPKCGEEL